MKQLDLLRHGKTKGGRLYRGSQDDLLTDEGWKQMQVATNGKHWDMIISSPLLRCSKFAHYLADKQGITCQLDVGLIELGFGVWQGKSAVEIGLDKVAAFKQNPHQNKPQGAEDLINFQKRVLRVYNNLKNYPNQHILLIAHAGVIRIIKAHLLGIKLDKIFSIEVPLAACQSIKI